jgi:hypothetical protein
MSAKVDLNGESEAKFEIERAALIQWGLQDDRTVYVALHEMKKNSPKLSAEEINKISEHVAKKIMQEFHAEAPPKSESSVRRTIRDILIGVLASGVWELLLLLATHKWSFDGNEGHSTGDSRLKTLRWKLTGTMDTEDRKDLEVHIAFIANAIAGPFDTRLQKEILEADFLKQFVSNRLKRVDLHGTHDEADVRRMFALDIRDDLFKSLIEMSINNAVGGTSESGSSA